MKKIVIAGLIGGSVFLVWFIVVDGILGFKRSIEMKQLSNERSVYEFLSENVTEPGRYVCDPEVLPEQEFPGEDPIYVVQYSGLGHDDSGQEMLVGFIIMFLAPLLGAWILTNASNRVLSSFGFRLLFFTGIGTVMSLFGIMTRFSIGGYPLGDTLALTLHDLLAWIVAGILISWYIKPVSQVDLKKANGIV
jgi:hypothetical protein